MLVLTRKLDEEIIINDGNGNIVVVTVLKIQGDKVSLGVKAPPQTQIWRKELLDKDKSLASGGKSMPETIHDLQIDMSNTVGAPTSK